MATNTTNLGLIKPAGTDKVRIAQINQNMDILDEKIGPVGNTSVQDQIIANDSGMAIVSTGNTHSAITSGQYVYIRSHSTLAEGLYKANSAISANATLSTSNVTRVSSGGMNDLKGQFEDEKTARNRGIVFGNTSMTMSDFIATCDEYMDGHPGLVDIGYVNNAVTSQWGLPFNGHVIGLVNASAYRRIFIVNNNGGTYIQSIGKNNGTWESEWKQVSAKPIGRHSEIVWSTYATAANNGDNHIRLYKMGQMCILSGYLTLSGTVPVDTAILTLPTDCRPIASCRTIGHRPTGDDANESRGIVIGTDGTLAVHNGYNLTGTTHYLNLNATWVTSS